MTGDPTGNRNIDSINAISFLFRNNNKQPSPRHCTFLDNWLAVKPYKKRVEATKRFDRQETAQTTNSNSAATKQFSPNKESLPLSVDARIARDTAPDSKSLATVHTNAHSKTHGRFEADQLDMHNAHSSKTTNHPEMSSTTVNVVVDELRGERQQLVYDRKEQKPFANHKGMECTVEQKKKRTFTPSYSYCIREVIDMSLLSSDSDSSDHDDFNHVELCRCTLCLALRKPEQNNSKRRKIPLSTTGKSQQGAARTKIDTTSKNKYRNNQRQNIGINEIRSSSTNTDSSDEVRQRRGDNFKSKTKAATKKYRTSPCQTMLFGKKSKSFDSSSFASSSDFDDNDDVSSVGSETSSTNATSRTESPLSFGDNCFSESSAKKKNDSYMLKSNRTSPPPQQKHHQEQLQQQPDKNVELEMEVSIIRQANNLSLSKNGFPSPYPLKRFEEMWESALRDLGVTMDELEDGSVVRNANSKIKVSDSNNQEKAQYGRVLFPAIQYLFDHVWDITRDDIFVDIGHGVGNAVLQAAYTVGCESRGIEVVADRNLIADSLKTSIERLRDIDDELHDLRFDVGNVELKQGRLEDPLNRDFIIKPPIDNDGHSTKGATKALVNNFNGVFAERSAKKGQKFYLDQYVAALFAMMVPGSVMVTFHPLTLPPPRSTVNATRMKHGLKDDDPNASFYDFQRIGIGQARHNVSWAGTSCTTTIFVYKYTRLQQDRLDPVFLCSNPDCPNAIQNIPNSATMEAREREDSEIGVVIDPCCHECNVTQKGLRERTTPVFYG